MHRAAVDHHEKDVYTVEEPSDGASQAKGEAVGRWTELLTRLV